MMRWPLGLSRSRIRVQRSSRLASGSLGSRGVPGRPRRGVVRLVFAYKEYCPKPHSCATSGGVLISGTILLITDRRAAAPRGPDGRRLDLLMSIDIADMQIGWQYTATLESTYKGTS
jgi:hypothetical protein